MKLLVYNFRRFQLVCFVNFVRCCTVFNEKCNSFGSPLFVCISVIITQNHCNQPQFPTGNCVSTGTAARHTDGVAYACLQI